MFRLGPPCRCGVSPPVAGQRWRKTCALGSRGVPGGGEGAVESWGSCRRDGSAEVPRPANNCVPVASRLLTLTDHPGFDLVVVFIRMGDRADGCYSRSGLMMEVPPVHDTLRNANPNALRTTAVPDQRGNRCL